MSLTFLRSAAGAALLAVLAAGCGTAATSHHPGAKPHHSAPAHAPVTTAASPPANPIPQHNGGDQDADNNGGPSDGDGTI